jgi:hypothetical protein
MIRKAIKPFIHSRPEKGNHLATIRYEMDMLDYCYESLASKVGK